MQKLILQKSKWICGEPLYNNNSIARKNNFLGEGKAWLLNNNDFMCCLGQFALQLCPELKKEELLYKPTPDRLGRVIPLLCDKKISNAGKIYFEDTTLSSKAIVINDSQWTTIEEKIENLKSLFKEHNIEIEVID